MLPDLAISSVYFDNPACATSFTTLKSLLSRNAVLPFHAFDKPFFRSTDASDLALGAVLLQLDVLRRSSSRCFLFPSIDSSRKKITQSTTRSY